MRARATSSKHANVLALPLGLSLVLTFLCRWKARSPIKDGEECEDRAVALRPDRRAKGEPPKFDTTRVCAEMCVSCMQVAIAADGQ